jgi:hypothetical protein
MICQPFKSCIALRKLLLWPNTFFTQLVRYVHLDTDRLYIHMRSVAKCGQNRFEEKKCGQKIEKFQVPRCKYVQQTSYTVASVEDSSPAGGEFSGNPYNVAQATSRLNILRRREFSGGPHTCLQNRRGSSRPYRFPVRRSNRSSSSLHWTKGTHAYKTDPTINSSVGSC